MFCYKCGSELPDEAKFCRKCGAKLKSDPMEQQAVAPTPAKPMQQNPRVIPGDTPKENKSMKLPLILGAGILVIIVAVIVGVWKFGSNSGNRQTSAVSLSQTYTNEADGISFKYPAAWEIVERSDYSNYYSNFSNGDETVVLLANRDSKGINSTIEVLRFPYDASDIMLTSSKSHFIENFDRNISIIDFSDMELDGVLTRMITYITADGMYYQTYFYAMGPDLYRVNFICKESMAESLEQFFRAIIESYAITVTDAPDESVVEDNFEDEISYKDIPVSLFFDSPADDVAKALGLPTGEDRDDDIRLCISDTGEVSSVEIWTVSALAMDGVTLNRNREGLVQILGEPYEEGYEGGYFMRYNFPNYSVYFELGEADNVAWRVSISLPWTEEDTFSYDTATNFSESLDYYSELSGTYDGRRGQSTLSVSIYTSWEDTSIGTVNMYIDDEWYYVGEIVDEPEKDVYLVATDTGEEVVLNVYSYDGTIVIELYVDGEYIDEYWMVEHYEP